MLSFTDSDPLRGLLSRLLSADAGDAQLLAGVKELAGEYGDQVYKEALCLLVGKHFNAPLARRYWMAAQVHRYQILQPEVVGFGFRLALFDYLQRVVGELNNPRLIEADYLNNITRSSVTDGLTGLYHQTYFKQQLANAIARSRRDRDYRFAVVLFDLDHFKQYNDRCGHLLGDETLRKCAKVIRRDLRDGDLAARYGGEEFALLLPGVDRRGALIVAERIRQAIAEEAFPLQERLDTRNLTISGGVAIYPDNALTPDELIEVADQELYKAKVHRNTVFSGAEDRRRGSRRPVRSLVEYASFDGALYRPALSLDVSEHGMGIGCENLISAGSTLSVRLTRPFWPKNLQVTATVRQIRRENELFFVGLEFDQALPVMEALHTATACRPLCAAVNQ